jgi:hypothetical protein
LTLTKQAPSVEEGSAHDVNVTMFPREELEATEIPDYVARHRYAVPQARLGAASWSLEPPASDMLMAKIRAAGLPLTQYAGVRLYYGIKTGLNEAFVIDSATRDRLVREDRTSTELIRKYLRGQDIARWVPEWNGQWMIALASSSDHDWSWKGLAENAAESRFAMEFPAIYAHLKEHEDALRKRADQGRYWWELRSCAYYETFNLPKIVYQVIQFHPSYALDNSKLFLNDKGFFIPSDDAWLLAVLNSPLMWWFNWRYLTHLKDEALTPLGVKMEALPIASPSSTAREQSETAVNKLIDLKKANDSSRAAVLDSLRMQYAVETPGNKLSDFATLDADAFLKEVLKRRPKAAGKLKASDMKSLREMYDDEALPMQARGREALVLERQLSNLVNDAYGLTPEDVALLWSTAPPRMPFKPE